MNIDLTNSIEIQLKLLTTAYFYGDYSIVHNFVNRNSPIYKAIIANDIFVLKMYIEKIDQELDELSDQDIEKYNQFYQEISNLYSAELEKNQLPLPDSYFEKLSERAIQLGNYATSYSALKAIDKVEKGVNQYIVNGVEILQSKEVKTSGEDVDVNIFQQKIQEAAKQFYISLRIKNPLGNQFQHLSNNLYFKYHEALRKYFKYVELSLLKELIEFIITYLVDDKTISQKIIDNLGSGKVRKLFLRYFVPLFSNGEEKYQQFITQYREAVELLKDAKSEKDFIAIQKKLLGRATSDNEYYQFLRELAVDHPVSTLLLAVASSPDDHTNVIPIVLKSGESLMSFLELDKVH